jgi:2-amino-4-hydroxy-6-hydroxymethyldihydropteridine diphosphokinase
VNPMRDAVVKAYIGLGGNLGDAAATVRTALQALACLPSCTLVAQSSLYVSAPVEASGPDYVNAVARVDTLLTAVALLQALQGLELQAGRERPYHNAPRTLDLDLLLYGIACIDNPVLTVPHPRMFQRAFVLVPLAEIAPDCVDSAWLQAVQMQPLRRIECATSDEPNR